MARLEGDTPTYAPPPERPDISGDTKQERHWQSVVNERFRIKKANDPAVLRRAYENFWSFGEPTHEGVRNRASWMNRATEYNTFKDEYVPLWEDAWAKHDANIPVEFFLQFDKNDLEAFIHTIPGPAAEDLHYGWQAEAMAIHNDRMIDQETRARAIEIEQERYWDNLGRNPGLLTGFDQPTWNEIPANLRLSDVEKARIRKEVEREFKEGAPAVEPTFWSKANRLATLFMGPVGWVGFSKGMTATEVLGFSMDTMFSAAAPILGVARDSHEAGHYNIIGDIMKWRESELEEQRQRDIEEIRAATGYSHDYAQQSVWNDASMEWNNMPEEERAFWTDIADGNEMMAMGLFISDRARDPEIQEQLEQYSVEYDEELRDNLRTLEETDFSDKDTLLDGLAWWGNVTGDFAVGTMLLFDEGLSGGFDNYMEAIRKADHSPAKLMGWEGTMLGIGFDLGMMALFDPTTYMFGGGAASAAGRGVARTETAALRMMKSAEHVTKRAEVLKVMMSPGRSHASLVTMSGLDSIGQAQLLGLADVVHPVFSRGDDLWRSAFPHADEVVTERLADLLPLEHGVPASKVKAATNAINKRGGFNRPITVQVGTGGSVRVAEKDLPALLASIDNNWNVVPVEVQYVDDVIPGYTPEQAAQMKGLTEFEATNREFLNEGTVTQTLEQWQAHADDGISSVTDDVLGSFDADGETLTVWSGPYTSRTSEILGVERGSNKLWYITNAQDRVVGGYDGMIFVIDPRYRGKGVMSRALEASEAGGDSFLPRLMERASRGITSFSEDAAAFVRRETSKRVAGKADAVDGPLGDDLWGTDFHVPQVLPTSGFGSPLGLWEDARMLGGSDSGKALEKIYLGQLMRNGRLEDMGYNAIARGFQSLIKKAGMADNDFVHYVKRYMTQRNLSRTFNTRSATAVEDSIDYLMRMWGDDTDELNKSLARIVDHQRGVNSKQSVLNTQARRLKELEDEYDRLATLVGRVPEEMSDDTLDAVQDFMRERAGLQSQMQAIANEIGGIRAQGAKLRASLPTNTDIFKVLDQAIDDFIEKYLEPMKEWADYLDENGKLSREVLQKGIKPAKEAKRGVGKTTVGFADDTVEDIVGETFDMDVAALADNADWDSSAMDDLMLDTKEEYGQDFLNAQRDGKTPAITIGYKNGKIHVIDGSHRLGAAVRQDLKTIKVTIASDGLDTKRANQILKKISSSAPDNYDMGVTPLDLAVAREMGGAKYMKYTHSRVGDSLRDTGHFIQNVWIIDKVIRPATAAVVTMDEAMRIVHLYGMPAFKRYMQDKMLFSHARFNALMRGRNPLGREGVLKGASSLSAKGQERIRRLQDWGAKLRADERTFFDQHGIGYVDIDTNDPLYRTYASQWTNQFLNDSGFRAFLEGEDAFKTWWDTSPDAAMLRDKTINVKKGSAPPTREEIYQGWETMWLILSSKASKAGKGTEFLNAWKSTADEISRTGKPVPLPESVYDNFIPVRGAQKVGGGPVSHLTDAFFDRFFMEPVNYRRGFIAEMVRHTEMKRLRQFYASQGKTIVPDAELQDVMNISGYRFDEGIGTPEVMANIWADSKFVPESYVNNIIERTVEKEIENVLYVWNMGSRAGQQSRMVFPFGKPYADMMGFWGREFLKTPILRGYLNNDNFLNLSLLAKSLPFNPKTGAMISRLAATDFTVTRGWIPEEGDLGEGLLPGSQSTDLSPLFFLPTEGDDILGSTLPGLGFIPLAFLDMVLNVLGPDPVEDPVEYWQWVSRISEGMPYFEYQSGGMLSRIAGGGTMSTLFSAAVDATGYFGGKTYFNITSELGDIGREIRRAREVGVIFSDEETLEELYKITDPELMEQYMMGIVSDANKAASSSHFMETMGRWTVPAKTKWDATGAELQQVWLDAASKFPEIFTAKPGLSLDTQEGKRQFAGDIRNEFFDLEGWERDLLVAAYPALAVNMVSAWDWTPKAIDANLPNSDLPYSTGGTPADMLRHDYYVNNGFVRPIQPAHRARLIVGQVAEARDNAIKQLFTFVANDVNDFIWSQIEESDGGLAFFEGLQEEYGERLGTKDARHLWENWWTLEDVLIDISEREEGGDYSEGRSLGVPSDMKPWSKSWPGLDEASRQFREIEGITIDNPDAIKIIDLMNLNFTDGMNGDQFHRMLADEIASNQTLAHGMYRPAWDQYTQTRLAFSNSAGAQLTKAKYDSNNSIEWRTDLIEWDIRVTNLTEQYADAPQGIPTQVRQMVIDEFNSIVAGSKDKGTVPWDTIWRGAYAPKFGPRDWEAPPPLSPFEEDGSKRSTTRVPLVHTVVDGDTLIVSETSNREPFEVRLLGVSADEFGYDPEAAEEDTKRLRDFIEAAKQRGDRLYLVTDPDRFVTNTDRYGRMLAWLWAGDEPFYFADEMNPRFTPSGGGR